MNNLKPCPFCGGEPEKINGFGHWYIHCETPSCRGNFNLGQRYCSEMEAAEAWNTRTNSVYEFEGTATEEKHNETGPSPDPLESEEFHLLLCDAAITGTNDQFNGAKESLKQFIRTHFEPKVSLINQKK